MGSFFSKEFTFDRVMRIIFRALLAIIVILILNRLKNVLFPFVVGLILAYLLFPLVKFFQHKLCLKNRILSVIVVFLLFLGFVTGLSFILIPSITNELNKALYLLNEYSQNHTGGLLSFLPDRIQDIIRANINIKEIINEFSLENLVKAGQQILDKAWTIISGTFSVLMGVALLFVVIIYTVFILIDFEKLTEGFYTLFPSSRRELVREIVREVKSNMRSYFRGQSIIALIVGILFAIGFKIISLPLGITMGLALGVLNLIPYMQWLGIPPLIILSILQSVDTGRNLGLCIGLSIGVVVIVQIFQDTYLVPRIMGKAFGMRPAIILLSLSIWGSLLGILGVIIALPSTILLYTYYQKVINNDEKKESLNNIEHGKRES